MLREREFWALRREVQAGHAARAREAHAAGADRERRRLELDGACVVCGGANVCLDRGGHEYVCPDCAAVQPDPYCPESCDVRARARPSAPYAAVYHLNEVLAAWLGRGPPISDYDMQRVREYLGRTRVISFHDKGYTPDPHGRAWLPRLNPAEMERVHFRQLFRALGCMPLAERWVQAKRTLCGDAFRPVYPSEKEIHLLRLGFARFSDAFFRHVYVSGRRRTQRDSVSGSNDRSLYVRHNLPHYAWIIQMLMRQIDKKLPRRVDADRYFPLPRTPLVRERLRLLWVLVCAQLGWRVKSKLL